MRKFFIALTILLFPVLANAIAITNATGTISDGQTITITGTAFGPKSPAAPYLWDRIDNIPEHNAVGDGGVVPYGPGHLWQASPTIQNPPFRVGKSAKSTPYDIITQRQPGVPYYYEVWKVAMSLVRTAQPHQKWFFNWWIWTDDNDTRDVLSTQYSTTSKLFRLYDTQGGTSVAAQAAGRTYAILDNGGLFTVADDNGDGYVDANDVCTYSSHFYSSNALWNYGTYFTGGSAVWQNIQSEIDMSGARTGDGKWIARRNNVPLTVNIHKSIDTDGACYDESWMSGTPLLVDEVTNLSQGLTTAGVEAVPPVEHGFSWVYDFGMDSVSMTMVPPQDRTRTWGFSHIYMDTTFARVVIGDASTYSACTHIEMQPPVTWSTTSITATLNQGSFVDGQQVWIYVIDKDKNVSNGRAITWATQTQTMTIYGMNFGDTGPTIYSWDDFEGGLAGTSLDGNDPVVGTPWETYLTCTGGSADEEPEYSTAYGLGGGTSALVDWKRSDGTCTGNTFNSFGWEGYAPLEELYVSFYRLQSNIPTTSVPILAIPFFALSKSGIDYVNSISYTPWNIKYPNTRFNGSIEPGSGSGNTTSLADCPWNISGLWTNGIQYPVLENSTYTSMNDNKFHRFEFWVKTEPFSTPTSNDGALGVWIDHKSMFTPVTKVEYAPNPLDTSVRTNLLNGHLSLIRDVPANNTDLGVGGYIDRVQIGGAFIDPTNSFSQSKSYFDNVYIASSRARVEIGDNQVWELCTKRDIQIVDSWSDDTLFISNVYTPQFSIGDQAYVFVINADGEVVVNGTSYTIETDNIGDLPIISDVTLNTRLFQVGDELVATWSNVGALADTITYIVGNEAYADTVGSAYQDSIHYTLTNPIDIGLVEKYSFKLFVGNDAGTDSISFVNYLKIIGTETAFPISE